MKWVLSRRVPPITRILLVESGPRSAADAVLPRLRLSFGPQTPVDLLTCLANDPAGLSAKGAPESRVWRVTEYLDDAARWRLLKEIRAERHSVVAIVCAGVGIMAPWRRAALMLLPAKFLVVNEHGDFFWLDRAHADHLVQLLLKRAGLEGDSAARTLAGLLAFPFALAYLLAYAAYVHVVRLGRMALGMHRR